ncbi:MAG: hypothetical protein Q8Q58_11855 [Candidatus Rokubacteria bacterium]|nr:hypothetical protein [Candidatus Rokubacteria bacterium]
MTPLDVAVLGGSNGGDAAADLLGSPSGGKLGRMGLAGLDGQTLREFFRTGGGWL